MSFHINPATGNAGRCRAEKGQCPFGGESEHFANAQDAREAYEKGRNPFTTPIIEQGEWKTQGSSPAYRIYTASENAYAEALVKDMRNQVQKLALGAHQNAALDALDEACETYSDIYPYRSQGFTVENAMKALTKARRLIGQGNPGANETVAQVQKALKVLTGKPPVPRKNTQVAYEYTDSYGYKETGSGKFLRKEVEKGSPQRRKDWGRLADREYAIVLKSSGKEIKVPLGSIKTSEQVLKEAEEFKKINPAVGDKIEIFDTWSGEPVNGTILKTSGKDRYAVEMTLDDGTTTLGYAAFTVDDGEPTWLLLDD